jgi:hypothetical protein
MRAEQADLLFIYALTELTMLLELAISVCVEVCGADPDKVVARVGNAVLDNSALPKRGKTGIFR